MLARRALWLPSAALLAAGLVAPLLRVLAEGAGGFDLALLLDPYLGWRVAWSLIQATVTCALALVFGLPLAWALARFDFPLRAFVLRALMLPFVMPTLVAAIGVLALFGPHGVTGLNLQDTPWLLLYGNLFYNLPLVVRAGVDGFAAVPASQLAAARTLGASRLRAFWRVEWPLVRPWLASALCLVFVYCFAGFGLALLLGGQRYATVEVEIYTLVAYELNFADAGLLALLNLVVSFAVALAYAWRERTLAVALKVERLAPQKPRTLAERLALAAALSTLLFTSFAPLAAVAASGLSAGWDVWRGLWSEEGRLAAFNTLRFTALATLCAGLFGVAHALAARRSLVWRAAANLPFIVSPVCVAFGLLLLYPAYAASLPLLLAAYVLLAYPFVAKSLAAALDAEPPELARAARTLGASPWRAFRRVRWPLLRPALSRGLAFAAATAVGEFAVTLFLSRPEWLTLTTWIYQLLGRPGSANLAAAQALATVLMALSLVAFWLIERQTDHARTR
ncbi:thiamine transport system permease protein [Crenobacter luteus]|uniref:ABC transporter permease n=1 Tax=Crenobacter luteus TaxID=1452487 RepID=A0A165G693_9NEIS|nr:iron ABC transporter permease [Crenobacter luteus]KZE35232.1 ABC transporter permease [Crenobacter luteus]TCP10671.1 thiamine transport system permease protein [Crenobacter luteus]